MAKDFRDRYGPWAVVTGASVGLGECFARALAARGLNLLLVARRREPLDALAEDLRRTHAIEVRTEAADVGRPDLVETIDRLALGAEVGLVVHNAAFSAVGPFLDRTVEDHLQILDVNCRAPALLAHHFGRQMVARGRGGIILVSSLAGGQGCPVVAHYAASKAYEIVLAEGLWDELGPLGVDVLACRAGPTRTPGFESSNPRIQVPMMEPEPVVEEALAALGHGPVVVAGRLNRTVNFVMQRLLSRSAAVRFMGRSTRKMYG
jgi:short-subunit dehydrogenase